MADWDKREQESTRAFAAFCVYRDLGPSRSVDQAYRVHTDRPDVTANGSWNAWCREHDWVARCAAFDAHQDQVEREAYESELRRVARGRGRIDSSAQDALERTLEIARKKLEFFETLPPESVPLEEIGRLVRLLAAAVKTGGSGVPPGGAAAAGPVQTLVREYVGVDVDSV